MTSQEVDEEHTQPIIKQEDEEMSEKSMQDMKPPLLTKVPKSKALRKRNKKNNPLTCKICKKTFKTNQPLRYHIRQMYFNLKAKTLIYEMKKVKQVWVEKVLNSNELLEITKVGPNVLRMKKTEPNAVIEPDNVKEIDLSYLYVTYQRYKCKNCPVCDDKVPKIKYTEHLASHETS
ncbi:PREDICTED: uncharacterized protein LOC106102017 isoform X2 [Papilio polytes]|uniref:uncharacterized protein LOC106102017 isoform X2 n=1 Tax=Papilio polytes TaxID=76194 RepID=UPI000675F950|nr:PREDICTED: uncharacterized protein LOC106102017 isoform X2 [Papilio polytes]